MSNRSAPNWFSHGVQWDAKLKHDQTYDFFGNPRTVTLLTVFASDDRDDAIRQVFKTASAYGFKNVNINKLDKH